MIDSRKVIKSVILLTVPFIGYYFIKNFDLGFVFNLNLEVLVGIVAIMSGLTGITMGLASSRQASLDAVKEYYQQGDSEKYTEARKYIANHNKLSGVEDQDNVKDIVNFYELWGLLNKKKYLPIWVFGGVSGIRVVEMYINLTPLIESVRNGSIDVNKPVNPFYGKNFELLSYRIYKKYRKNFSLTNFEEQYKEEFSEFIDRANSWGIIRTD